jgi:hypothetical protein
MNLKEALHKIAAKAAAEKMTTDAVVRIGDWYADLVIDKSPPEIRNDAKLKLREFYSEHGDIEIDRSVLCRQLGLKNTNADRQWLAHQLKVVRIEFQPTAQAAAD